MQTKLTDDAYAILLLCAVLDSTDGFKPLTISEYSKFARWLYEHQLRPGDLPLLGKDDLSLEGCGLEQERLKKLLRRSVQLGFALEKWEQAGIWITARSDSDYPVRYKHHLKDQAPPFLYGIGDRALLSGGGLCIVGSRNVNEEGVDFTKKVAERCAKDGVIVVSGGARGVDEISMVTALRSGGKVIGVLADSLLKKSIGKFYREAIAKKKLLLLSPYHPEAGFSTGNAMGRNKLVYALSDYALVVQSDYGRGGTWAGATEELKRDEKKKRFPEGSIPVFVRKEGIVPEGYSELRELGALPFPVLSEKESLSAQLCATSKDEPKSAVQGDFLASTVCESSADEKHTSDVPPACSLEKLPVANEQALPKEKKTKENHISNSVQQPCSPAKTIEASDTRDLVFDPEMGLVKAARALLHSVSKKKKFLCPLCPNSCIILVGREIWDL